METQSVNRYSLHDLAVLGAAWLGFVAYIFSHAWVAEDAYISFRVIDNVMNGYGLRWNTFERVQVYTHPLWLLLHIPFYAIWSNLFLVSIGLSILCTGYALCFMLFAARKPVPISLCFFIMPLALSKSFIDYAASGLENPLSYFLYVCFCYVLLRKQQSPYFWFWCSLSVALALFNRLDTFIFYLPPLAYLLFTRWRNLRISQVLLGATPLIGWFYFALFYYGFLFPNTKYAKLDTGLDPMLYLSQGVHYAKYLLFSDTVGALAIVSLLAFFLWPKWFSRQSPAAMPRLPLFMALGIALYCFYVISIGGDYMMGRFWALPVFAACCVWLMFVPGRLRFDIVFATGCAIVLCFFLVGQFQDIRRSCSNCIPLKGRIINAYGTFGKNQLVAGKSPLKLRREGKYTFAKKGKELAKENPPPTKKMWYIGMIGYYAGPNVKIIDELGLADPLLARLPAIRRQNFYIGHFRRNLPPGYMRAVETGKLGDMPSGIRNYYEKLRLITSGDLLSMERLKTIVLFNLGYYDHWKEAYIRNDKESS